MKLAIQCPGCGEVIRAANETTFTLRRKRHVKGCARLRDLAKAQIVAAARPRVGFFRSLWLRLRLRFR